MQQKNNNLIYSIVVILLSIVMGLVIANALFHFISGYEQPNEPWAIFQYIDHISDESKVGNALFVSLLIGILPTLGAIAFLFIPESKKLFGVFRFASSADIKKAGLFIEQPNSIFLGSFSKKLLFFTGPEFVMVYAPTRSGKGVSIVVPNLLQFAHSIVCLDIKFENYQLTSGFRKKYGQKVFLFAPGSTEYKTHQWNPLSYISSDPHIRLNDIDKITNYLLPTPPNVDPMWSTQGRSLIKTAILLVLDTKELPKTLGEVTRQLRTQKETSKYFTEIIENRRNELDDECLRGMSEFIATPSKTAGGIRSGALAALNPWTNPLVDAATSGNSIDLRKLRKEKMTVYLGLSQDDLESLAPVFNLFIQQMVSLNTQKDDLMPAYDKKGKLIVGNPEIKYQCLLLLDEFCSLGKMATLEKGVSFIAGYGLRLMPIFQSHAQLVQTYGDHSALNFIENHAIRVCFRPTDMSQARALSEQVGHTTVKQKSRSAKIGGGILGEGSSETVSEAKRALLVPEEIMQMEDDDQIILARGCKYPIYAKKIAYMNDKRFSGRILEPAEIPTITPKKYPIRGKNNSPLQTLFDSVKLPEKTNRELTDEELETAVDSFFDLIEDEDNSNTSFAKKQNLDSAISGLFQ